MKDVLILMAGLSWILLPASSFAGDLDPLETLAKNRFFATHLATPPGQSWAACHGPEWGFAGPNPAINAAGAVYPGAVLTRFGHRRPPTSMTRGRNALPVTVRKRSPWRVSRSSSHTPTALMTSRPTDSAAASPRLGGISLFARKISFVYTKIFAGVPRIAGSSPSSTRISSHACTTKSSTRSACAPSRTSRGSTKWIYTAKVGTSHRFVSAVPGFRGHFAAFSMN